MTSRVGGVLALIAVAVLAGAMFVPWWDGHPTVDGNDVRLLEVDIGLFGGERCNTGGDGACTKLPLVGGFKTLEAIEVGAIALAGALTLAVGALALSGNRKRKSIGSISIATGAAVVIVALVLIVTGPDIHVQQTVTVPTGVGGIVGLFGGLLALVAAIIARRDDRPAIPRAVANVKAAAAAAPVEPTQQGFDVQALIADDALRPAQLNAEPKLGRPMPPSTTGNLPGPAGPLVPPATPSAPLFSAAPQLRPLYEMPGTGAFVPPPPPPLPIRAPTPIARAELEDDGAARKPPPLRRLAPPPPTRPPSFGPPGSQGPPMVPASGPRPPPLAGNMMASTSLGVGPLVPPSSTQVSQVPMLPPPLPGRPALSRVPVGSSPLRDDVPTPPPLELPTPEPDKSGDAPAVSASQLVVDEPEDSDDADEASFDRQSTYQHAGDSADPPADDTSPGLGIAHEETPAAHLLAPDDIETRGMRKLATRDFDEQPGHVSNALDTTPVPVLSQRVSEAVLSSAKRPPPMTAAVPDTDENDAMDERELTSEPTGDTGDPTVDHEPVFGTASSPPRIKTPPAGAMRADVAHAATDLAPAPSLVELKAAQMSSKPVQVAPKLPPVAVAPAAAAQPPPPKALKTPAPNAGPQPACPQCEAPMSWVEEHLRFYCRSCKMYF